MDDSNSKNTNSNKKYMIKFNIKRERLKKEKNIFILFLSNLTTLTFHILTMSNILETPSYLCFCPLCQQRNPGRGFIVSARTYRAHQNAAIIHEAISGDPSVESTGMNNIFYNWEVEKLCIKLTTCV